jgi:hypothetical protein
MRARWEISPKTLPEEESKHNNPPDGGLVSPPVKRRIQERAADPFPYLAGIAEA